MYPEAEYSGAAKMTTGRGYSDDVELAEPEVERELDQLYKTVAELSAVCSSLEKHFESVVRPAAVPAGAENNPERSINTINTKLGNKIAQIRRTTETTLYALNSFIQRKEI